MPFSFKEIPHSLCGSCQHSGLLKYRDANEPQVFCTAYECRVERPVAACSRHLSRGQMDLWEMKKIAWLVDVDLVKKTVGFIKPKDRTDKQTLDLRDVE